jgi:hypothetical protein
MWSFRAYLNAKCADPGFAGQYLDQCNICPKTVKIITTIRERGLTNEDVARTAGVALERLELLESADQCIFDDTRKIARCLDLSFFGECRKAKKNWTDP